MATQAKIDHVAELVEKIKKAQSVVLVDYQGISVNDETALRRKMREAGAEYLVTKNRLFKIALKEAGVEDSFEGVEALAKLPSRDQLLSMLLNSMLGPIRKLAYATVAIADKKEAAGE